MALMDSNPLFFFLITGLAVWRITHLFHAEDGPFDFIVRLRTVLGQPFFGTLMDCFYCLSLWIAAPAAWLLCRDWPEWLVFWPALSAAAIFMEQGRALLQNRIDSSAMPSYEEEPPEF
jgi:hypothetical protein